MNSFNNKKGDGTFGIANLLLKKGIVTDRYAAESLSKKILIGLAVIFFLIITLNLINEKEEIPEKYFYDPEGAPGDI